MVLNIIKTAVTRATQGQTAKAGGALVAAAGAAGASGAKPGSIAALVQEAQQSVSTMFEEKEWKCHCGHVFRAAGEWYPTEPSYCEAPGCPNPTFYLDGPGRQMLEAGNVKPLESKKPGGSMGGRFGGGK